MSDNRLIVALDLATLKEAEKFVRLLRPQVSWFKIGMRLFTAAGPDAVKMVREAGAKVFLDLKFHDIPNTVAQACESAVDLGVSMLNVHAAGGREMLEAAAKVVSKKARLIGVTVLTSEGGDQREKVLERARLCQESGLDGVVCSPNEAAVVRKECGPDFLIVTPGIRLVRTVNQARRAVSAKGGPASGGEGSGGGDASPYYDDQKRFDSPAGAIRSGADYIVVGRPIIESPDPLSVARQIVEEISLTR